MSPIAQSAESPSLASTSTVPAPVEQYIVFLAVPLAIVALLMACTFIMRALVRRGQQAGASEAEVERATECDEPKARLVNLSAKHIVVVESGDVRHSVYVTLDATTRRPTHTAASKRPTVVEPGTRQSLAIEFDVADVIPAPLPRACCKPERALSQTRATHTLQPAIEAWWITPKTVVAGGADTIAGWHRG